MVLTYQLRLSSAPSFQALIDEQFERMIKVPKVKNYKKYLFIAAVTSARNIKYQTAIAILDTLDIDDPLHQIDPDCTHRALSLPKSVSVIGRYIIGRLGLDYMNDKDDPNIGSELSFTLREFIHIALVNLSRASDEEFTIHLQASKQYS